MDDNGILNPRFVQRVKDEWDRTKDEVRRATAPLVHEAERAIDGLFHPHATGPTTPLDGCTWQQVTEDEEALRQRLERTIADLTMVEKQTVTLEAPGNAHTYFLVRATLTDGTTWQARVPLSALGKATEPELRLWALRLAGKVRQ
jgi:hypothetical protein